MALFIPESAAPGAPATNYIVLYAKADGRIYYKDDAGTEVGPLDSVAAAFPVVDSTAVVKGSADATKLLRIEVDGFTTATTRVMTPPNQDFTAAGINVKETFTAQQTPMNGALTDGATINWNADSDGQIVSVTTAAARTFAAPTNIVQNALYILVITTGGFTPSWNAAFKWAGATAPSGLTGVCIFTFIGGASSTLLSTGYQVNVS